MRRYRSLSAGTIALGTALLLVACAPEPADPRVATWSPPMVPIGGSAGTGVGGSFELIDGCLYLVSGEFNQVAVLTAGTYEVDDEGVDLEFEDEQRHFEFGQSSTFEGATLENFDSDDRTDIQMPSTCDTTYVVMVTAF